MNSRITFWWIVQTVIMGGLSLTLLKAEYDRIQKEEDPKEK